VAEAVTVEAPEAEADMVQEAILEPVEAYQAVAEVMVVAAVW
jgi:hypothetical protein